MKLSCSPSNKNCAAPWQVIFSVIVFVLLGFEGGFEKKWGTDEDGNWDGETPALFNALFSTIAFLLGASTSCVCGYLGMRIAVFANARTTLEARKGITAAFVCGRLGRQNCLVWAVKDSARMYADESSCI